MSGKHKSRRTRLITSSIRQMKLDLERVGVRCMPIDQAAGMLCPPSFGHTHPTINYFCRLFAVGRCIDKKSQGLCVRNDVYWRNRLDGVLRAAECGCHTVMNCPDCMAEGRAAADRCPSACRDITIWESKNLDQIRKWREELGD